MSQNAIPAVGTTVLVVVPQPYAHTHGPARYTVTDARGRELTLQEKTRSSEPGPPAGVPCLVHSLDAVGRRSSCEAVVVGSGTSVLVVDVAPDPRQHRRYRRACKVVLEVPGSDIGLVHGVLEDLSAGGMRVHTPVLLPVDQRVFVSVLVADTQAILAIAEVRGVHRGKGQGDVVTRLQFTLIAPSHRARLAALLEWPFVEEDPDMTSRALTIGPSAALARAIG